MSIHKNSADMSIRLPELPRLVLRVGFAGSQRLPEDARQKLGARLDEVFEKIGLCLTEICPSTPIQAKDRSKVASFYDSSLPPLLRLTTGLCEGSDEVAAESLKQLTVADAGERKLSHEKLDGCLETELAAILPFDFATYRKSRKEDFLATFERQAASCAYVMTLDGIYKKTPEDTPLDKQRRARGYRAQSALMLRHSDLIIAAADPGIDGKAGGTLETVHAALRFQLPVVFIHLGTGQVHLVEPGQNFDTEVSIVDSDMDSSLEKLETWVSRIVADPDLVQPADIADSDKKEPAVSGQTESMLIEYFTESQMPPVDLVDGRRISSRREKWVWDPFIARFQSSKAPKPDVVLAPYDGYRRRATQLNYQYSGLYKGAFLLNYLLAILAVTLAAFTLLLMGDKHTGIVLQIAAVVEKATDGQSIVDTSVDALANSSNEELPPQWLLPTLVGLVSGKFLILGFILWNTRLGNRGQWNDRAVDYRYLAERLRGMYYLPLSGSFQPPTASRPQYASRVVRQSSVDWLFDAICRSVSPADLPNTAAQRFPSLVGDGEIQVRLLSLEPQIAIRAVGENWIRQQAIYHWRVAQTMGRLWKTSTVLSHSLGWTVLVLITIDLAIVIGGLFQLLPSSWNGVLHFVFPGLIFLAAVLPAAVAAFNGIRFQSECQRLAERSSVMKILLAGRPLTVAVPPISTWRWFLQLPLEWGKRLIVVVRHLFLLAPVSVPLEMSGGRWLEVVWLADRIDQFKADVEHDPGSWSLDVLELTETVAGDFVQEATEWSVLYAKELSKPG